MLLKRLHSLGNDRSACHGESFRSEVSLFHSLRSERRPRRFLAILPVIRLHGRSSPISYSSTHAGAEARASHFAQWMNEIRSNFAPFPDGLHAPESWANNVPLRDGTSMSHFNEVIKNSETAAVKMLGINRDEVKKNTYERRSEIKG